MTQRHRIDKTVFQVDFSSERTGFLAQAELPDLIKTTLLPVVDEVFDRNTQPGTVWRIDTLEVDLGQFLVSEYKDEMAGRLRECLQEKLAELRLLLIRQHGKKKTVKSVRQKEFELLEQLLTTGVMPWHGEHNRAAALEELLAKVMEQDAGRLLQLLATRRSAISQRLAMQLKADSFAALFLLLLREEEQGSLKEAGGLIDSLLRQRLAESLSQGEPSLIAPLWQKIVTNYPGLFIEVLVEQGRSRRVRHRVAGGFGPSKLARIFLLLEPMEGEFISEIVSHPALFRLAASKLDRRDRQERGVQVQLWEFTLAYLLADRGSRFNRESFLESLLQQMANHENLKMSSFLDTLLTLLEQSQVQGNLKKEMLVLLRAIAARRKKGKRSGRIVAAAPEANEEEEARHGRLQQLHELKKILIRALLSGQPHEAERIWPRLMQGHQKTILSVIRDQGRRARVRKSLAATFPLPMLRDIIVLLEPSEHLFIEEVIASASVLKHSTEETEAGQVARERLLFEFSLAYLLIERGSRFNQKAYLAWMLRRMASHANMAYGNLVMVLCETMSQLKSMTRMQTLLLELLNELQQEVVKRAGGSKGSEEGRAVRAEEESRGGSRGTRHKDEEYMEVEERLSRLRLFLLKGEEEAVGHQWIIKDLEYLLSFGRRDLAALLGWALEEHRAVGRLIPWLTEPLFQKIVMLLRPQWANEIIELSALFFTAWRSEEFSMDQEKLAALKFGFILFYLVQEPRPFERQDFIRGLYAFVRQEFPDTGHRIGAMIGQRLALNIQPSRKEKQMLIITVLAQEAEAGDNRGPRDNQLLVPEPTAGSGQEDGEEFLEEISVANSGMVLAAPYLPRLFDVVGLIQDREFKGREARERGIHLLQYMVNEKSDCPEYQLVLNKVLCGFETGIPLCRSIRVSEQEHQVIEELLQSILQNWQGIGNTSVAGLREAFLNRQGVLRRKAESWHLLVEEKPYDMLLDRVDWNFRTIRYPWMDTVLHVDWR